MEEITNLLHDASNRLHLTRERAIERFDRTLSNSIDGERKIFAALRDKESIAGLQEQLCDSIRSPNWEGRLGTLRVAAIWVTKGNPDDWFLDRITKACDELLEDEEVRVRMAVGEVLRALSARRGICTWEAMGGRITSSIVANMERDEQGGVSLAAESAENGAASVISSLLARSYRVEAPGTGEMRHGTEGWKCLETSYRALQQVMDGVGAPFGGFLDDSLRELIYKGLLHPNRFVREVCHFIISSMCTNNVLSPQQLRKLSPEITSKLGLGLSDNWSQVRFAASVATRSFLLATVEFRDEVLPSILPHMCLNRYYVAEGVRTFSQATWAMVMGEEGRAWVAKCAPSVVSYYIEQSKANNHAVREAACACIAELMVKVDREAVAPHVPKLLRALLTCFRDASWPVRDAACLACGRCVRAFPQESKEILDKLYDLWFAHLWDNIFSVREDSAIALADAARAYGADAISRIVEQIRIYLPMANDQPVDSRAGGGLENTTTFGVAASRNVRANDAALHTDQTMFSCGSLAPKLARGGDGCMDHGFARDKEPWEATDGSLYMVRELVDVSPDAVVEFLPEMAKVARLTHFAHCVVLQETLWKALPHVARGIGKQRFKAELPEFVEPMFRCLTSEHRLCQVAAGSCIAQIRDLLGPRIFEGRLNEEQRRLLHEHPDIPSSTRFRPLLG